VLPFQLGSSGLPLFIDGLFDEENVSSEHNHNLCVLFRSGSRFRTEERGYIFIGHMRILSYCGHAADRTSGKTCCGRIVPLDVRDVDGMRISAVSSALSMPKRRNSVISMALGSLSQLKGSSHSFR